jgi:hypothetical protein
MFCGKLRRWPEEYPVLHVAECLLCFQTRDNRMEQQTNNPVMRLLQSSKALVAMPMIIGSFIAFKYGKVSWTECTDFVKWIWLSWAGVQGAEDVVKHYGASKGSSGDAMKVLISDAVKNSMSPPAEKK